MSWKLDLYSQGRDAFQILWKQLEAYAFPPFSLIPRVLQKVQLEQASIMLITLAWQTQAWYPKVLQNPILIPKRKDLLLNPDQEVHPLVKNQNSSASGMENFRQKISSEGLSEKAISLISCKRRKSSVSHYNSAWGKFSSWCIGKQADPFRCSLILILEFLSESYEKGLQYNTLAGYRSAISAFHEPINGVTVGKHP